MLPFQHVWVVRMCVWVSLNSKELNKKHLSSIDEKLFLCWALDIKQDCFPGWFTLLSSKQKHISTHIQFYNIHNPGQTPTFQLWFHSLLELTHLTKLDVAQAVALKLLTQRARSLSHLFFQTGSGGSHYPIHRKSKNHTTGSKKAIKVITWNAGIWSHDSHRKWGK